MRIKFFLVFFVFLLALSFLNLGIVSAASYQGSFNVNVQGGSIVIGSGGCEEDWSSSTWSSCSNNQQTFICIDKNQCGTVRLKPSQCGDTRACSSSICGNSIVETGESCDDGNTVSGDGCSSSCTTEGGGGGGGGGGGSGSSSSGSNNGGVIPLSLPQETCIEKWQCDVWSNEENECGSRECRDINNCGTEELKPLTTKTCSEKGWGAGITGNIIGGIANFAKSKAGAGLIFIAVVVVAAMVIMNKKKFVKGKKQ